MLIKPTVFKAGMLIKAGPVTLADLLQYNIQTADTGTSAFALISFDWHRF
jgi:hypothetical protein